MIHLLADGRIATAWHTLSAVLPDPADNSLRREAHVAGYTAYALMVATVAWGVLTTAGTVRHSVRRQTTYGAHMVLSIMSMCFVAIHAMSHLFKHTGAYSISQEFVPFATPWNITLGVVAFELMVAAAVSVWLQRRLGYNRWLRLHRIAYPAYVLAIGHVVASAHHLEDGIVLGAVTIPTLVLVVLATSCHSPIGRRRTDLTVPAVRESALVAERTPVEVR